MLDSEGGEEYTKLPSNVSGLSELWEQFSETICARLPESPQAGCLAERRPV